MKEKNVETFETTDFYLVVWLVCKDFRLDKVYKNQVGRNTFILSGKSKDEAINLSNSFFNGGLIPAITYKNILNDLKTVIRNFEKNGQMNEVNYDRGMERGGT